MLHLLHVARCERSSQNVLCNNQVYLRLSRLIMSPIKANLQHIQHAISIASAMGSTQSKQRVSLIAVSKTKPTALVREAFAAGQRFFGENYAQEGIVKIVELNDLRVSDTGGIEWHFIGPLQSNKARLVAQHFDWAHGVDRLKIAEALDRNRVGLPPLNICIQVNVSAEQSKGGVMPDEVLDLASQVATLPGLKLRGLMTIIENTQDEATQRAQFGTMRKLQQQLIANGFEVDTLSMGMSQDFRIAIEEGATMVRIGSAIFGERDVAKPGSTI